MKAANSQNLYNSKMLLSEGNNLKQLAIYRNKSVGKSYMMPDMLNKM